MTRFFGKVGYVTPVRVDGVVEDVVKEYAYYGEEKRNVRKFVQGDTVLGQIEYQTRISIMADAFALENFENIRYVEWMGSLRVVDSVEPERPHLILTIGEKYNGPGPEVSNDESP